MSEELNMQTWAILAAKHAALTSGTGPGVIPAAGWDSLDGVAVGMLLAGIGFAVVSARRVPSCQLPPAGSEIAADSSDPAGGRRMARFRRRMDGLLTGMLSDDADKLTSAAASSRRLVRPAPAGEQRFEAPVAWRGDYVDPLAERRSADSHRYPEIPAAPGSDQPARELTGCGGSPWPWLAASATVDGEQLWPLPSAAERRSDAVQRFMAAPVVDLGTAREARARAHGRSLQTADDAERASDARDLSESGRGEVSRDEDAARRWSAPRAGEESAQPARASNDKDAAARDAAESETCERLAGERMTDPQSGRPNAGVPTADQSFWGPRGAAEEDTDGGYRSRHRPDGQASDMPQDGRRAKPRHAAPPASFGATLTRRLTSTKLTSRSATHAG